MDSVRKCSKCKRILPISNFSKNGFRKSGLFHYCKKCDSVRKKKYRLKNPDVSRNERIKRTDEVRELIIAVYGGCCRICGEDRGLALVIHHIGGGGNKHRDEINRSSGTAFYEWIKKEGYPEGYELLCGTCHLIHHREREKQQ